METPQKETKKIPTPAWLILLFIIIGSAVGKIIFDREPPESTQHRKIRELNEQSDKFRKQGEKWRNLVKDPYECYTSTIGREKAKGIKMRIYFPCAWKEFDSQTQPNIVTQYGLEINEDQATGILLFITPTSYELTDEVINKISSKDNLRKGAEEIGQFISSRTFEIKGIRGSEIVIKKVIESKNIISYEISNMLYYKNNIIVVSYFAAHKSDQGALELYNQWESKFRTFMNKTEFLE